MRRFALMVSVAVAIAGSAAPAQDKEAKTAPLHLLEKNAGANFGDWVVWRHDEGGKAVFLVNQKSGFVIYLPWASNGWINFRPKNGDWHVLHFKDAEKQNRADLMIGDLLKKDRPGVTLENGKFAFKDWTVEVTKDKVALHCSTYNDRVIIPITAAAVYNGKKIVGQE